jgi:hypothetical protein
MLAVLPCRGCHRRRTTSVHRPQAELPQAELPREAQRPQVRLEAELPREAQRPQVRLEVIRGLPEAESHLQRLPVCLLGQARRVSQVSSFHPLVKRPSLRANSISL